MRRPTMENAPVPAAAPAETQIRNIPIEKVQPNPWNRKTFDPVALQELTGSIKNNGIKEPLIVRPKGDCYEIASGNRRWLAAKEARLKEVPCYVQDLSDEQVAEDNIELNIQREDVSPLELARMVHEYAEKFGKTQEQTAQKFGKSRPWVTELVGFLALSTDVRKNVKALTLGWNQLRALKS